MPLYGGASGSARASTLIIASSEASAAIKARADVICPGTADQATINPILASSSGAAILTGGRFFTTAPILVQRSGFRLVGTGRYIDQTSNGQTTGSGTEITLQTGFTGAAGILVQGVGLGLLGDVLLEGLNVNGNSIGSGLLGIRFRAFGSAVQDVGVYSCTGDGLQLYGDTLTDDGVSWSTYDTRISNIECSYNSGAGIAGLHNAADLHMVEVVSHNNLHGIHMDSSSAQITGFHCYANTQHGVWLDAGGPARTKLVNGKIEHSGRHGLFCDGTGGSGQDGVQVVSVGFNCNSELNDGVYAHLSTDGPGGFTNGVIMGCQFGNSDAATNLPWTPLFVSSNVQYLACVGNNFGSGGLGGTHAAPYVDAAALATSRFTANIGLSDRGVGVPVAYTPADVNAESLPPTAAIAQTISRRAGVVIANQATSLVSGTVRMVGVWLPSGTTVTSISFYTGTTAAVTPTNWFFGLYDSSLAQLRITANQTTAAIGASTVKTVNLTSTFTTTYSGLHYLAIMVTAGTMPTLMGIASSTVATAVAPVTSGTSSTGQTTAMPAPAAALTATALVPWAWCS